jgi:hypothetical protein
LLGDAHHISYLTHAPQTLDHCYSPFQNGYKALSRTSRLCNGYLTKKESVGVLHLMTWPPQSPDLNPIEIVWDELVHRVNDKQPLSAQHMWELFQDCWKSITGIYRLLTCTNT